MVSKNISVAIVISTYNWPTALESIFQSILHQTFPPDEILVADDGSGFETHMLIEKYTHIFKMPLMHVWQEDKGFRKALVLNKAIKLAKSDYIIQIDGDILLHKKFIEDHLKNAAANQFVQGCRVLLDEELTFEAIRKGRKFFPFYSSGLKNRINATRLPFLSFLMKNDPFSSHNTKACNLAFWRLHYVAVNGYDNRFNGWGFEDDEFVARLINYGVKKKRLKLAALCYHLNHKQESKLHEVRNMSIYRDTINRKNFFSVNGLSQV